MADDPKLQANYTPVTPTEPGHGVKRLNSRPKLIFFLFVCGALMLALYGIISGSTRPKEEAPAEPPEQHSGTGTPQSEVLAKLQKGYTGLIEAPQPPAQPAQPAQPIVPAQEDRPVMAEEPTRPEPVEPPKPALDPQLVRQAAQMKVASFQAAITAPTAKNFAIRGENRNGTSGQPLRTSGDFQSEIARINAAAGDLNRINPGSTDVSALYQSRLAQIQGGMGGGGMSGGMPVETRGRDDALLSEKPDPDKWTLDSQVRTPVTPYEVLTGTVIPATLVTGINSDLPGQMIAQVSQNVYDTSRGNHLIIPQGTRLIGQYSSNVAYGQERVLVAWNRLVFPDGKTLDIGSMPGATGAGYSGLKDQVNNHYFRLFGSAFLMSMISAGVVYSQDKYSDDDSDDVTASSAMAQQLANQIGQTAAQLIQKNLNIAPTLEIRPGFRFNVVVTKDMVFKKPYASFDY